MRFRSCLILLALLLVSACRAIPAPTPEPSPTFITIPSYLHATDLGNVRSLPRYGVLELSFHHAGAYANMYLDVQLEALFTSPRGNVRRVSGFYYGGDEWRVRFRPDEVGHWTFTFAISGTDGSGEAGLGSFDSTPSDDPGPVRRNPNNPFGWIFANGAPFFPIGLEDCITLQNGQLASLSIDGEGRGEGKARQVTIDEYLSIYAQAGMDLFRFSPHNCSYDVFDDLDHYRPAEMNATDQLLQLARQHGFRVMFGFFGFYNQTTTTDPQLLARQKRYLAYSVARWGAYVDFWELLNESRATDAWATTMASAVRSVDPEKKPISLSDPRPGLAAIDINAPHWYESENELQSDLRVVQQATVWKRAGQPVIVGEQGNAGMNWDPGSGLRMRLRAWTALFQQITLVFWNTAWAKNGMFEGVYTPGGAANIYLGPEERGYLGTLSRFASRLDAAVLPVDVPVSAGDRARAYGLASDRVVAVYLHHYQDHTTPIKDLQITLDLPPLAQMTGQWIDPATGRVISCVPLSPGRQTIAAPSFVIDLALLVAPGSQVTCL